MCPLRIPLRIPLPPLGALLLLLLLRAVPPPLLLLVRVRVLRLIPITGLPVATLPSRPLPRPAVTQQQGFTGVKGLNNTEAKNLPNCARIEHAGQDRRRTRW